MSDGARQLEKIFNRSLPLNEDGFARSARLHKALPPRGAQTNQDQDPFPVHKPLSGAPPNNRGQSALLTPGQVNIDVASTPMSVGEDAETISVALGYAIPPFVQNPPPPALIITPLIVGHAQFGIGSARFQVDFDWQQGCIISLPASYIRIFADYNLPAGAPGSDAEIPQVQLSAAFSYGYVSRTRGPQLSTRMTVGAGASVVFNVPAFATGFTIVTTVASPNLGVIVGRYDIATSYVFNGTSGLTAGRGFFSLFQSANTVSITNNDIAQPVDGFIIWSLF